MSGRHGAGFRGCNLQPGQDEAEPRRMLAVVLIQKLRRSRVAGRVGIDGVDTLPKSRTKNTQSMEIVALQQQVPVV